LSRINVKDLVGGIALLAIAIFFSVYAAYLGIGTGRRMGPGYFPLLAGLFTGGASLFIIVPALFSRGEIPRMAWRPFLTLVASIAGFIVVMPRAGLLPAIVATVCVAALADPRSTVRGTLLLAAGVALGAWLVFIVGLGLPMRTYRIPF
jgi:hypothetical protein